MRLFKIATLIMINAVAGCTLPPPISLAENSKNRPSRIVSLDFCADQYVLKLANRGDILALSMDATSDFSYMRKEAEGIPTVRSTAEDVLALNPDLIVRSYGGGYGAQAFFERAGVNVHQLGSADDFDGLRQLARDASIAFGQAQRGDALVADFDRRLAAITPPTGVSALYMTPGGITSGPGSMIDLMMTQAGLTNFVTEKGWNELPLETLVTKKPDMAITAFFQDSAIGRHYWSSARHPVALDIVEQLPVAALDGSTISCGGWFVMDAIEALSAKGREVQADKQAKMGISQ